MKEPDPDLNSVLGERGTTVNQAPSVQSRISNVLALNEILNPASFQGLARSAILPCKHGKICCRDVRLTQCKLRILECSLCFVLQAQTERLELAKIFTTLDGVAYSQRLQQP